MLLRQHADLLDQSGLPHPPHRGYAKAHPRARRRFVLGFQVIKDGRVVGVTMPTPGVFFGGRRMTVR